MGTLYVVATPIGNLGDISSRAKEVFGSVELILAEDTRVARKLLAHIGATTHIESYHQHSPDEKKLGVLKTLMDGKDVALVSDAGTPGISDPGNELVDFIYSNISGHAPKPSINIIPIPGPSAALAALSVCGFDVGKHMFLGFWPKKKQSKVIKVLQSISVPFVYFDSPHRVVKNLERIATELGERRVYVGRELTKMHETSYRGNISEVIKALQNEKHLKGEVVVVVE